MQIMNDKQLLTMDDVKDFIKDKNCRLELDFYGAYIRIVFPKIPIWKYFFRYKIIENRLNVFYEIKKRIPYKVLIFHNIEKNDWFLSDNQTINSFIINMKNET